MAGYFYPLPPTHVGGRQPYAPRLGLVQSGPTPDNPPQRSLAALGIILAAWIPPALALPKAAGIAPLIPVVVADAPPVRSNANFNIIRSMLTQEQTTVIFVCSIAPLLQTPATPDAPPVKTYANLNSILRLWQPVFKMPPSGANIAPLIPVVVVPDNPPVRTYTNLNVILNRWIPPYVAIPKLTINQRVAAPPPLIVGQIPGISTALNSGTHDYDLSVYFANATSYSISPSVETGWSFNTGTGVLTIDTDVASVFGPYTVTATNTSGSTPSNAFGVTVTAWTQSGYNGGTAVSSTGVMGTTFLNDATPVPAGAFYLQGFAHASSGKRYVALWPASNQVFYRGGIASRSDGAMLIDPSGTMSQSIGGWAMTYRGEVIASTSAPDLVHSGYGLLSAGNLCVSEVS